MSYEPPPPCFPPHIYTAFTFDITEKEFVIQGFCAPSTAVAAYGTAGFPKQMNPPYESELGFGARNECVCWTRLHISEDHTGFQPDVQLSLLPSIFVLTCLHGNEVTSSTAAGGRTRQKPGQNTHHQKTERQSMLLLSLKASVK